MSERSGIILSFDDQSNHIGTIDSSSITYENVIAKDVEFNNIVKSHFEERNRNNNNLIDNNNNNNNNNNNKLPLDDFNKNNEIYNDRNFNTNSSVNTDFLSVDNLLSNNKDKEIYIDRETFVNTLDLVFLCLYTRNHFEKDNHKIYNYKTGIFYRYEVVYHQLVNINTISNKLNLRYNWLPNRVKLDDWIKDVHKYGNAFFEEIYSYINISLYLLIHQGSEQFKDILGLILPFFGIQINVKIQLDNIDFKPSTNLRTYSDNNVIEYIINVLVSEYGFPEGFESEYNLEKSFDVFFNWASKQDNVVKCVPFVDAIVLKANPNELKAMSLFYFPSSKGSVNTNSANSIIVDNNDNEDKMLAHNINYATDISNTITTSNINSNDINYYKSEIEKLQLENKELKKQIKILEKDKENANELIDFLRTKNKL